MQIKTIMIASLFLLLLFPVNTEDVKADATITLEAPESEVNITATESGQIVVNGTITSNDVLPSTYDIYANISGVNGTVVVEPSTAVFLFGIFSEPVNFRATITIPAGTNATSGTLTVWANGTMGGVYPVSTMEVSVNFEVAQYYDGKIELTEKEKKAKSGEVVSFEVNITNLGNGKDTLKIDFKNKENLTKWGLKSGGISLKRDETGNLIVEIQTPTDFEGTQEFEIFLVSEGKAKKENNTGEIGKSVKFTIKVEKQTTVFSDFIEILKRNIIPISAVIVFIIVLVIVAVVRRRIKRRKMEKIEYVSIEEPKEKEEKIQGQ